MPETPGTRLTSLGPIGRLGLWSVTHGRLVLMFWVLLALGLGALLPRLEHSLSGAGWQASGSESVRARAAIQAADPPASSYALAVVLHGPRAFGKDPAFAAAVSRVERTLRADPAVQDVLSPARSGRISPDGRTVVVVGGRCPGGASELVP